MDYKEKYEAALEQARKELKICGSMDCDAARQIFRFFPELRESEDERIRKALIAKFEPYKQDEEFCGCGFTYAEILAWLEKQKEQKVNIDKLRKDIYQSGYNDGYQHGREDEQKEQNKCPEYCVRSHCMGCPIYEKQEEQKPLSAEETELNSIAFLEQLGYTYVPPKKEQKPGQYLSEKDVFAIMSKLTNLSFSELIPIGSDEYKKIQEITSNVRRLLDYPIEQKPVEWTKEDAERYISCLQQLGTGNPEQPETINSKWFKEHCYPSIKPAEWSDTNELVFKDICKHLKEEGYNGWITVLKTLHSGEPKQPIVEWSKEDKLMIQCCITALSYYENNAKRGILPAQFDIAGYLTTPERVVDWLKSLRPSWKPSEEDLDAIKELIDDANKRGWVTPGASRLYEQLKAL